MGTNAGVDVRITWEEAEQKEFMKAIRQPLMVQTPLQVVIENLFQRLVAQASALQAMKEKVDRIALKDVTVDELLERIKMLEAQQGDAAGVKLNPFNQQEILARLENLEHRASELSGPPPRPDPVGVTAAAAPASSDGLEDLDARLARLEQRMSGVYNLNGKLVALEQIAAGLGVAVPDLDMPTGGGPPGTPPQAAAPPMALQAWRPPTAQGADGAAPEAAAAAQQQQQHPGSRGGDGGSNAEDDSLWPTGGKIAATAAAASRVGSPALRDSPEPGSGASAAGAGALARGSSPLHLSPRGAAGVVPNAAAFASGPSRLGSIIGGMAAHPVTAAAPPVPAIGASGVSAQRMVQLGQEVAAVRGDQEALREGLERLGQQVAGLKTGLSSNASEALGRLQAMEESVGVLQAQVAELTAARREAAARHGADVSHADLALLRSQVEAAVAEARTHGTAAAVVAERDLPAVLARLDELAEGVKKGGEPRDMDTLFHERINGLEAALGDVKTELRGVMEAAIEGAAKMEDLQALEEALEGKAPADALRALQLQTAAMGQAVAGLSDSLALRPELGEALRSLAAGAAAVGMPSGPVATRVRCLTCDQPITKQPPSAGGAAPEGRAGKGSFLPRLESMPAKEGPPGGPGVMTAELRASREDRLAGLQGVGGVRNTLKAGEVEEYASGGLGVTGGVRGVSPGQDASPGRLVDRSRATRVAVGGGAKGTMHSGKPVFL